MKGGFARSHAGRREAEMAGFACRRCQGYVSAEASVSGVGHRNHCPYCLWSRHLDLWAAGDRLAACKALMRPLGLTWKRSLKKYPARLPGELMLVHQCVECGKLSLNRIAADDAADRLLSLFEDLAGLEGSLGEHLQAQGVQLLQRADLAALLGLLQGALAG